MTEEKRVVGMPQILWGFVKLAFFGAILATPIAGAWLASSLAAYNNGSPRLCLLAALLLFPILPLVWEGIAAARHEGTRSSRFIDRLILRTLFINILFVGALLWRFPAQSSVALSTRGDWFLDGKSGPGVDELRSGLFSAARGLDWVRELAKPNPYKRKAEDDRSVVPTPTPPPAPASQTDTTPEPIAPGALWPQPNELHHAVREIPPESETSIESVALYLRAHSSGPTDRIKALHDYVADRIAYDVPALSLPRIPDEDADAEPVFRNKRGVCAGYARLLRALAQVTGDQVEYIVGDARVSNSPDPAGGGHAWNAAFVEGHWQLIDATWDAGAVNGDRFEKGYRNDWLFTPPEVFGVRHHPEDDAWQLREHPLEKGAFMRQPMMDPAFFRHGMTLVDPDRSQVTVHGAFDAHLERRDGVFLLASARPVGGGAQVDCNITGSASVLVHCALAPGAYDVELYGASTQSGSYPGIGSFGVNVSP
ncbi:MAG: transglutaminase domain-containing protein [Polyangia bacterium]